MITLNSPFKLLLKVYIQIRRFCIKAFKIEQFTLNFVFRNCLAALIAMGVAWSFGSHEYYWAAVTSWVMAINGRGQIMSKSLYRTVGTAIGAVFAFAIMPLSSVPWLYILVLSVWAALCASTACLLRRFRAYTAQLAGYTATIIGGFILVTPPELHVGFAVERFISVLIGIASSTLVALVLIPKTDRKEMGDETRQWAKRTIKWAADIISKTLSSQPAPPSLDLWRGISEFEYSCTCAAIESSSIKKYLSTVRSILASLLTLIAAVRAFARFNTGVYVTYFEQIEQLLRTISEKIVAHQDIEAEVMQIHQIAQKLNYHHTHTSLSDQTLSVKVESIALSLDRIRQELSVFQQGQVAGEEDIPSMVLHYDWARSLSTGIRTFIPTLLVGMVWLHIGSQGWIFAFVITSIACILFGAFPGASKGLKGFLISISTAAFVYIVWSLLAHWLNLGGVAAFIAVLIFTGIAAFPISNGFPRAIDFNTNFPVLMLGMGADHFAISTQLSAGFAVSLGVVVTCIALLIPVRHENDRIRSMDDQLDVLFHRLVTNQWTPHQRVWEECIYDLMMQTSLLPLTRYKQSYLLTRYQAALDNGVEIIWLHSIELRKVLSAEAYTHINHALHSITHFKSSEHIRQELLKTAVYLLKQQHKEDNSVVKECLHQAAASLVSLAYGLISQKKQDITIPPLKKA